jgi:uncharacterized protein (UPF0276 family)
MLNAEHAPKPLVGLGLDYKFSDRYPGGLAGLCDRYRNRLTHLSVVALPSRESARAFKTLAGRSAILHHLSDIAPANPRGPDLARLELQDAISRELCAVWCGEDIGIWSLGPYDLPYFAPPVLDADVAEHVARQIARVQAACSIPFLAEIPSCSFVTGGLTLGEFFWRLVQGSDCGIVLDVSHVYSYALVTGRDPFEVLRSLPLSHVCEAHVAGGHVDPEHPFRYVDTHSDPILLEVLALLSDAVGLCPRLRAVTYEIGVRLTTEQIDADLARLETLLEGAGYAPGV